MMDWLDKILGRRLEEIKELPEPQEFIEGVEYVRGGLDKPLISKWLSNEQVKMIEKAQPTDTIIELLSMPPALGYFIIKEYKTEFNKHFEVWELVGKERKLILHLVGSL
jgi:hypothetical protein